MLKYQTKESTDNMSGNYLVQKQQNKNTNTIANTVLVMD